MFKVILLLCAAGLHPSDCTEDTALTVMTGPECQNEVACGMLSQAYLASSQIGQRLPDDCYLKVKITGRSTTVTQSAEGSPLDQK